MAFKFVAFLGLVALANAGVLPETHYISAPQATYVKQVQVPAVIKKVAYHQEEHYEPANYEFKYAVEDEHTGDYHSQQEKAENGAVSGSYQLHDADGYLRIVEYTADDHNGFVAHVRREPLKEQTQFVKKIVAAPQVHKIVAQPAYVTKTIQVPVQPVYKTVQVQEYPHNYHHQY